MGIEIAKGEGLNVFREDREFLLRIRNGELSYDEIKGLNEKLLKESDEAFNVSDLMDRPDHLKAKGNLIEIRKKFYGVDYCRLGTFGYICGLIKSLKNRLW